MQDTGVYIHLPYCKSICPYCDFNSYVQAEPPWAALEAALRAELRARLPLAAGPVASVYLGGGTPSLAPAGLVEALLGQVRDTVGLQANPEITLEANPGTVTEASFVAFRAAGVNRISLGWQSTHDRLLRVLGRGHSAADSHAAFVAARAAGFQRVSLDLIFAVPGQTLQDLDADLRQILALRPEHVSLYALTYKEGTPFFRRRARGSLRPAPEALECDMMAVIAETLGAAGYQHYEVSNYCLPGHRARHNSLYWSGGQYVGAGPGAHSFYHQRWERGWRWEGLRDPKRYMAAWQSGQLPEMHATGVPEPLDGSSEWVETLTPRQMLAERMLCGLRHDAGVSLAEPVCRVFAAEVEAAKDVALRRQWAQLDAGVLRPTALGLQHADALAELFF